MKKLIMPLALAAALCAHGQDLTRVEIKSKEDIAALAAIPEWRRGSDTNGITMSVCVGAAEGKDGSGFLLTRRLTFDADGRLVCASPISTTPGLCYGIIGGFISFEEMRKALFPTEKERVEREYKLKSQRELIRKELRQQQAERESHRAIQQGKIQRTPGRPIAPHPSEIPRADEK